MKRPFALVGAILAVATFASCLAALYWMWTIQKPVQDNTTYAFAKADEYLALASRTIDDVKGNLEQSRARVQFVSTSTTRDDEKPGFVQQMLARTVAKQVAPDVNDVQHSLEKVTEASIVINSILGSLHDIDGVESLDNNQVRDLQTKLNGVTRASMDLGDLLNSPRDDSDAAERSARIAANLDLVISLASDFQKGVNALRKKVEFYRAKSAFWIERGPTYATIGLGWVMVSQVVVLVVALRAMSTKPATTT